MKLIRHILSHLLLITLLVAVCAVYFYRHQVLPERYAQEIDHYAGKIHPKLAEIASHKQTRLALQKTEAPAEKQTIGVIYVDDVPLVEDSGNDAATKEKVLKNTEEVVAVVETKPEEHNVQSQEIVEDKAEEKQTAEVVPAQEEVKQVESVNEEASVSEDKAAADYLTILREARTAFGEGNMSLAVNKYNELIELEDEADFYGELGNVYYAMGNWNQAGSSYYEAAVRLVDSGQLAQVGYLQRVIQGLDAERAEKLAKRLATSQGQ